MSRTKFALKLEHSKKVLSNPIFNLGNTTLMLTPAIGDDYWLLRVPVSERQAVVLIPKFGTYGIGFQQEEDWNTNLPSACPAEEIYSHIKHNKRDRSIPDARCVEAIRMLQEEIVRLTGNPRYKPVVGEDGVERRPF